MANKRVAQLRKIVAVSLHPSIHSRLRELAAAHGVSMSRYLEMLITGVITAPPKTPKQV